MKRRVQWTEPAEADFLKIVSDLALENPYAADRVNDRIETAVARLADMAIGRPGRVSGTYELVLPPLPYIIAYALIPQRQGGEQVDILRVIHGKREWPAEEWPRD